AGGGRGGRGGGGRLGAGDEGRRAARSGAHARGAGGVPGGGRERERGADRGREGRRVDTPRLEQRRDRGVEGRVGRGLPLPVGDVGLRHRIARPREGREPAPRALRVADRVPADVVDVQVGADDEADRVGGEAR